MDPVSDDEPKDSPDLPPPESPKRWQAQFPYHWDADEIVSRRQLLRYSVYTSAALSAGTTGLLALSAVWRPGSGAIAPILRASELAEGSAHYFHYPQPDEQAVLLHLPGGRFTAFSQRCTHLSCAVFYQPERERLLCPCHEGVFDPLTGEPVAGPPRRRLPRINLRQDGDVLYAVGLEP